MDRPTVQLSEPVAIPEPYQEACVSFLRALWEGSKWNLQELWGIHDFPLMSEEDLLRTFMADHLADIARAATGQTETATDWDRGVLMETIQTVMESLFSHSAIAYSYQIPAAFWEHPVGQMVARAQIWLRGDQLITITDAAKFRSITTQAISNAITAGRLTAYPDPDAAHPQKEHRLVLRSEVEAWTGTTSPPAAL